MLQVGRFALCGNWETTPTPAGCLRLILRPSLALSNGWSPWTQAGLHALDASIRPGMTVADVGTGSGILAIAAVLLGASAVEALDIHPEALAAAQANAVANHLQAQFFIRYANRFARTSDLLFLVNNLNKIWTLNTGINLTF